MFLWNSTQQTYIYRERERREHVQDVRKRLNRNETNARAPAHHQQNNSQHQPSNVPQQPPRPVIGNLQPSHQNQTQSGLQQSSKHLQVQKAKKETPEQLEPLIQKGFLNRKQPVPLAAPIRTGAFDPLQTIPGNFPQAPSAIQGAVGGPSPVQNTRRPDDNIQESQPTFSFNLPYPFRNPSDGRGVRANDPRLVLYRDPELDMAWDNFNLIASDIDNQTPAVFYPQARTGANNPFTPRPLAESDPIYPKLPNINNSPYGQEPNQISSIDLVRSVSPPIRTGTLGPPAVMTVVPVVTPVPTDAMTVVPVMTQGLQTLPNTVQGLITPVLTLTQPATNIPIPDSPGKTGTRRKSPTFQPPLHKPTKARVTRSSSGGNSQPRQYHQELVNVGKNIVDTMKSKHKKKESKETNSVSDN